VSIPAVLLDEVCRHCDLRERLPLVPATARVRGVYFHNVENVLEAAGKLERYRAIFPERYAGMRWYPVSELLLHIAIGGAILTSAERVHEGMSEIGRRNARGLSESLVGRTLLRLLSNDPIKLLRQGAAVRRQTTDYGGWEISFPAPRTAVMRMRQEYLYLESYCLGAAHGTFEAIELPVRVEVELDDRFDGKHVMTW
jgi:uncharacterized protein (TIGR02265 family)